jgi:hypothetical protein
MGAVKDLMIGLDEAGVDRNAYIAIQNLAGNDLPQDEAVTIAQAAYVLHKNWGEYDIEISDFDHRAAWQLYQINRAQVLDLAFEFQCAWHREQDRADNGEL